MFKSISNSELYWKIPIFLSTKEGIIPALEPAHALAVLKRIAKNYDEKTIIVMNMCGRGDKDIFTVADELQIKL